MATTTTSASRQTSGRFRGAGVAEGDGGVFPVQHHGCGLAHHEAAAHDDGPPAGEGDIVEFQDLKTGLRRAGRVADGSVGEDTGQRAVGDAVNVLFGRECGADGPVIKLSGQGRKSRQPWMAASALMPTMTRSSSSCEASAGRRNCFTSTPTFAQRAMTPSRRRGHRGVRPPGRRPAWGQRPFPRSAAQRAAFASFMAATTGAPFKMVDIYVPFLCIRPAGGLPRTGRLRRPAADIPPASGPLFRPARRHGRGRS